MKQLFYTSCVLGRSVSGGGGFTIRSVTPALGPEQRRSAIRFAGYQLPANMLDPDTLADMPVRLALLDTSELGRLLCHTTYVGQDPTTGREGNIFSHLLTGVPTAVNARSVILTWGNSDWVCEDGDFPVELPEVDQVGTAGRLNDAGAVEFLAVELHRDLLRFVLSALLTTENHQRVFIAAHGSSIAWIVYCLTRMLPSNLMDDFTFSTFEIEPLNTRARLIGSWWGKRAVDDLPDACYGGSSVAYNPRTGRKSPLQAAPTYVEFALDCVANGDLAAIDDVLQACKLFHVDDAQSLELVFRIRRSEGELSQSEVRDALRHPQLACIVAKRPAAAQQLLQWAVENEREVRPIVACLGSELRNDPPRLTQFVANLRKALLTAASNGHWKYVEAGLDGVLPELAPRALLTALNDLTVAIADISTISLDVRISMISRLSRAAEANDSPQIDRLLECWLDSCAGQVGQILAAELPNSVKVVVCMRHIKRHGEVGPALNSALAADEDLFFDVFEQLASDHRTEEFAISLVGDAVNSTVGDRLLGQLIAGDHRLPSDVQERCLEAALLNDPSQASVLARRYGDVLATRLGGTRCLNSLADRLLWNASLETFEHLNVARLLNAVRTDHSLDDRTKQRLSAWFTVEEFLTAAVLEKRTLQSVAAALPQLQALLREQILNRIADVVADELIRKSLSADVRADLENILRVLGPLHPTGASGLFSDLLNRCGRNRTVKKCSRLLTSIARLGLASNPAATGGSVCRLDETNAFLREAIRGCSRKVLRDIDNQSREWSDEVQACWKELTADIRPKTFRERLTFWLGAGTVVLGAAVAALLIWSWSN